MKVKKLFSLLLVLSLLLCVSGMAFAEDVEAAEATDTVEAAETETAKIELDFDKLYALHAPEDVVMKVNGEDVTWGDYFYCVYSQASKIMTTMAQIAMYYGVTPNWDDPMNEEGTETIADLAISNSVEMFKQQMAIEKYAQDNCTVLSEEDEALLKEETDEYLNAIAGEEATEEEINAALSKLYVNHERFDEINRIGALYDKAFIDKYGENCEKVSDADAVKYLEDNSYMAATHILFMTVDPATGEALSDDVKAEKKAQAEDVLAQLKAIEDKDELVTKFNELKTQYCEDTGKEAYPNGYMFTPGTMVTEFEDAVLSLGEYELSDIVETSYGYHIIMRLPLDPDFEIDSGVTARTLFAEEEFASDMQALMDASVVEYADGYEVPNLSEYVK